MSYIRYEPKSIGLQLFRERFQHRSCLEIQYPSEMYSFAIEPPIWAPLTDSAMSRRLHLHAMSDVRLHLRSFLNKIKAGCRCHPVLLPPASLVRFLPTFYCIPRTLSDSNKVYIFGMIFTDLYFISANIKNQ